MITAWHAAWLEPALGCIAAVASLTQPAVLFRCSCKLELGGHKPPIQPRQQLQGARLLGLRNAPRAAACTIPDCSACQLSLAVPNLTWLASSNPHTVPALQISVQEHIPRGTGLPVQPVVLAARGRHRALPVSAVPAGHPQAALPAGEGAGRPVRTQPTHRSQGELPQHRRLQQSRPGC